MSKPKILIEFDLHGEPGNFSGSARPKYHNLSCCPFCRGFNVEVTNTWTPCYWVECPDCGAAGPSFKASERVTFATAAAAKRVHRRGVEGAISAWEDRL